MEAQYYSHPTMEKLQISVLLINKKDDTEQFTSPVKVTCMTL